VPRSRRPWPAPTATPAATCSYNQDLFSGTDAGLSLAQQAQLGGLLKTADRGGLPIRVAIIGGRTDLGSVSELWRSPRSYARFLGIELSLAFNQRLLVVMPNGLGINWPGHPTAPAYAALSRVAIGPGPGGLLAASETAVRTLAAASGVKLPGRVAAESAASATSPAPNFTLSDESGRPVSLRSRRGKVVILAFNDAECTTICPMTTTAMLDAKAILGRAGSQVQLLGVEANPHATSLEDVASYSQLHGLLGHWHFLTGSLPQLGRVWNAYKVQAEIENGLIAHTPALFVISPQGREAKVYITQQSYAAIGQFGQVLAREAASLLPGHPPVDARLSYAPIAGISPAATVSLPRAGGGRVTLGPGRTAHLQMFFATW
jgi:cytochrome oxidase Cu insertion factor (SCO1/SenC/PrrC family)